MSVYPTSERIYLQLKQRLLWSKYSREQNKHKLFVVYTKSSSLERATFICQPTIDEKGSHKGVLGDIFLYEMTPYDVPVSIPVIPSVLTAPRPTPPKIRQEM